MIIEEPIDHVPPPLLSQLKRGGRMVMPLGRQAAPSTWTLIVKGADGKVREQRIMPVRFSPLQEASAPDAAGLRGRRLRIAFPRPTAGPRDLTCGVGQLLGASLA